MGRSWSMNGGKQERNVCPPLPDVIEYIHHSGCWKYLSQAIFVPRVNWCTIIKMNEQCIVYQVPYLENGVFSLYQGVYFLFLYHFYCLTFTDSFQRIVYIQANTWNRWDCSLFSYNSWWFLIILQCCVLLIILIRQYCS